MRKDAPRENVRTVDGPAVYGGLALKLQHLNVIASIGRHRNAHRAAAELGLTQPAISKIVREAEAIFGATLFDRGRQGMHPNRIGEVLLARTIGVLNDIDSARAEVDAIVAGRVGHLRLGVIPFVTPTLISGTLRALEREHVELAMEIHEGTTGELVPQLLGKEFDCLIARFASEREAELEQQVLYHQKFSVVVGRQHRALGGSRRVRLIDTTGYGWIVPPPRTAARQMLSSLFVRAGLPPPSVRIETSSMEVIKAALTGGELIALLPSDIALHYARTEQLRVLPFRTDDPPAPLTLITRRGDVLLPSVARFCATLLRVAARHDRGPRPA
jgi:DNA-binding transcriptional LysR family regulator